MKKATRAMVAKEAGVSLPMVSYVLNNSHPVSEKTRRKILAAIEKLNYVPDVAAQSMVKKKSKLLTIISNNMINPMYGEIILEFEKEAFKKGYTTNICAGFLRLKQYIGSIVARRVDGLYFASIPNKVNLKDLEYLISNGVKISCGNYLLPEIEGINRLDLDYADGMRQAICCLVETGHKKIIYANGFVENYLYDERCDAYKKYINELSPESGEVIFYGKGPELMNDKEGYEVGKQIVDSGVEFDAVICTSDMFAYGVMHALQDNGISIPEQVSVIGFENLLISEFTSPRLSSVTFDRHLFSETLVNQLIESINNNTVSSEVIPMALYLRESVKRRT